jgi:hypothetical protein
MNVVAVSGFPESHIYLTDAPRRRPNRVNRPRSSGAVSQGPPLRRQPIWHSDPAYRAERRSRDARLVLDGGQLRPRECVPERPVGLPVEDQAYVAAGHLDAIGVRDDLALPVDDAVSL